MPDQSKGNGKRITPRQKQQETQFSRHTNIERKQAKHTTQSRGGSQLKQQQKESMGAGAETETDAAKETNDTQKPFARKG